jgi:hypothetical protein
MICKICGRKFKNIKSIQVHISHGHKISSKDYYDDFLKKDGEGICYCANETKFINMNLGYHKYCSVRCQSNSPEVIRRRTKKTKGENHWMKRNGNPNKGKTYEEIYGPKKAKELKDRLSRWFLENCFGDGNPFYGKHHNVHSRELIRSAKKGKTYEEIYGFQKGLELRLSRKKEEPSEYTTFNYCSNFYDLNLRKKILTQQGYKCPICFRELMPYKKNLHHINYTKKDNRRRNLIYLCVGCHSTTNGDRSFWKAYLKKINREIIKKEKISRRSLLLVEKTTPLNFREKIINRRIR